MLEKLVLLASLTLAGIGGTAGFVRALGYREIPVGITPHPSQPDLVLLQQGKESGLRLGDRGTLTLQGYSVTESAGFQATEIPFTVVELGSTSATARLPIPIQSLEPIAASIDILDIHPADLRPPSARFPQAPEPPSSPKPAPADNPDTGLAPTAPSGNGSGRESLAVISREWFDTSSMQLCGPRIGGAFGSSTPSDKCGRVTREDLLVQAIVSGQHPAKVSPADAFGAAHLYRDDRRLIDVVRFHFLRPDTPRARVAVAQEYLRFYHYRQALEWLAPLVEVDFQDDRLEDAVIHSYMYAAYHAGLYDLVIAFGDQLVEPTSDRQNLVAAAHYQQQNYKATVEALEALPPLGEILNNRAIAYYQLDRPPLQDCDSEPCQLDSETELIQQQRARPLLEGVPNPSPISVYNLAVLDIRQKQLSASMNRLLEVHSTVSEMPTYDPAINQLKLELLQYVDNHDASMNYLAELSWNGGSGLPDELGQAVGVAGSFAGVGSFLPLALFNLVSYASEHEREQAVVEQIQQDLSALYSAELELIPLVEEPEPISINPFAPPRTLTDLTSRNIHNQ